MSRLSPAVTVCVLSVFAALAFAAPPRTISYQGYLKNGTAPAGATSMTFSLYSTANGAGAVWNSNQGGLPGGARVSVTPVNGIYSVELGASPQPALPVFDRTFWLGVKAADDPEMRPLQQLTSVPYALQATVAETVPDGAITDTKITGPISSSKIPDLVGLQTAIAALQTTMAAQQTTLTAQQTTINQLQTTTATQQTTITGQQSVINALNLQISHLNSPPDVSTGGNLFTAPGTMVILYGKVADPDLHQNLTWSWSITSRPAGSTAQLSSTSFVTTLFTPDMAGSYQISLTASDGVATVTANATLTVTAGMLGRAQLIETDDTGTAYNPQVTMDGKGAAMAVWLQQDGIYTAVWASRYTPGAGWSTPHTIENIASNASNPQIAMDRSGNAIVVWYQSDGIFYSIYANRYSQATGSWGTAQLIESSVNNAYNPQVAMDINGNAVAVWYQFDGTYNNIYTNHYSQTTGTWGMAQLIENNANNASSPQVVMDNNGNAVAVWQQSDGIYNSIYANRYSQASGTWSTAQLIENNANHAYSPQVAMDSSGNAVVVWHQYDGTYNSIYANRYSQASGTWGAAQLLENNANYAYSPQVAVDSNGNAIAVWYQYDGTYNSIYANRYSQASGTWGAAQLLENNAGSAFNPQVAMDSIGNAVVVWYQYDGVYNSIYANRYSQATGGWGGVQLLENNTNGASNPQVAMDSSGYAVAVWQQFDGVRDNIWGNLLTVGWPQPQPIETDNRGSASLPQVANDGSGNAMAVWQQFDGTYTSIYANRYSQATGTWGAVQLIENNANNVNSPQVAMDGSGNAIVVWYQYDGSYYNIYANRYSQASGAWGTAQLLENNANHAYTPQIAMDSSGNAVVVWYQSDGSYYNIYANRYNQVSGLWNTAQVIGNSVNNAANPQVAMNSSGTIVVVWQQTDGLRDNIWARFYSPSIGWGTAQVIESDNTGAAVSPQVAMNSSGTVVVVWQQSDGFRDNAWVNRFTPGAGWGDPLLIDFDNTGHVQYSQVVIDPAGNPMVVWQQSDGIRTNIMSNRPWK